MKGLGTSYPEKLFARGAQRSHESRFLYGVQATEAEGMLYIMDE